MLHESRKGIAQMIRKIVVPVDGSQHSVKAVELASDLASKYDADITLLHVLLRGHMPEGLKKAMEIEVGKRKSSVDPVYLPNIILARNKKEDQLTIEELTYIGKYVLTSVAAICRDKGVSDVDMRVEEGDPAKVIIQIAEDTRADMIVMGNRGLSDFQGMLFGSVSHKVSQLAKCTCVTVR
jgi:nucleotide-binding universal stress UspA family protein